MRTLAMIQATRVGVGTHLQANVLNPKYFLAWKEHSGIAVRVRREAAAIHLRSKRVMQWTTYRLCVYLVKHRIEMLLEN